VSVEHVVNSNGAWASAAHTVSQPHVGQPGAGQHGADRVRLAVVESEFASVTVSLDTAGHSPRLHVQDNETGDDILLSAIELASLCLANSEDRAGWLKVGLYRTESEPAASRSDGRGTQDLGESADTPVEGDSE
jgi:hypothetical protein